MIPTRVYVYDKQRALNMADYLAEYGIEVEEVNISTDGRCEIVCFGNETEIKNKNTFRLSSNNGSYCEFVWMYFGWNFFRCYFKQSFCNW